MIAWQFLSSSMVDRLALTFLHFLWQGCAVVLVTFLVVRALPLRRPTSRYAVHVFALAAMAAWPVATFVTIMPGPNAGPPTEWHSEAPTQAIVDVSVVGSSALSAPTSMAATPAAPAATVSWFESCRGVIVHGWFAGVVLLGLRLLIGWLWLQPLRRDGQPLPAFLQETAERFCAALSVRLPRILVSARVGEAVALGLFRPMILLPASWLTELPPDMLAAVVAHELAHLRRYDLWVNLAQRIVETLLFFHPAVWWISRCGRFEREMCCDDVAVGLTGERLCYVRTLEWVGRARLAAGAPHFTLAIGGGRMVLLQRIRRLLQDAPATGSKSWATGLVSLAIVTFVAWYAVPWAIQARPGVAAEVADETAIAPAIAKEPGKMITGTVIDAAGKAVADAEVFPLVKGRWVEPALRTDARGQFQASRDLWKRESAAFLARKDDQVGWFSVFGQYGPHNSDPPVRVVLLPLTQTLKGTLADPQGQVAADIPVEIVRMDEKANSLLLFGEPKMFDGPGAIFRARSDKQGRFTMKLPAGVELLLTASHTDWVPLGFYASATRTDVGTQKFTTAGRITGRVFDPQTGQPLRGATLYALAHNREDGGDDLAGDLGKHGEASTDDKGRYEIVSLRPGAFHVVFHTSPEQKKWTAPPVDHVAVEAGKATQVDFPVRVGRLVTGTVIDSDTGQPASACPVAYNGAERPGRMGVSHAWEDTDAQGKFRFYVHPGPSYFYAALGGRWPSENAHRAIEVLSERDPEPFVLTLGRTQAGGTYVSVRTPLDPEQRKKEVDPDYRLHITLRPTAGQPVGNVNYYLVLRSDGNPSMTMSHQGATYSTQLSSVWGRSRKAYLLIDAEGFAPTQSAEFVIDKKIKPLTVEIKPVAHVAVRGKVVDLQGKPIAKARVRVGQSDYHEFPWGLETLTDDAGRYELKRLRVGDRFHVRADKDGFAGVQSKRTLITTAETVIVSDLSMGRPDKEIVGQVLDYDERPIPHAKIRFLGKTTQTDAGGAFHLKELPAKDIAVEVEAPGFTQSSPARIAAGERKAKVYLFSTDDERPWVRVELRPKDGKTVSSTEIAVHHPPGRGYSTSFEGNETTISGGDYWRPAPGRKVFIDLVPQGYALPKPVVVSLTNTLQTVIVDLEPAEWQKVRGRVIDENGQPVQRARVGLSRSSSDPRSEQHYFDDRSEPPETAADGRFEIGPFPPGMRVAVYVNRTGFAGILSDRRQVARGQHLDVGDLCLPKTRGEFSGQVVSDDNRPLAGATVILRDLIDIETRTDLRGRFTLPQIALPTWYLDVSAEDHEPSCIDARSDKKDVKINMKRLAP